MPIVRKRLHDHQQWPISGEERRFESPPVISNAAPITVKHWSDAEYAARVASMPNVYRESFGSGPMADKARRVYQELIERHGLRWSDERE